MSINYIQISVGPMDNYTYIIYNTETHNGFIVDPGWEAPTIITELKTHNITPVFVLLTHGHGDHHGATQGIIDSYPLPVYISDQEAPSLIANIPSPTVIPASHALHLDNIPIQIIPTPGHTPGGTCFIIDSLFIAGDTLFINGCGRCDLANSDIDAMYTSLETIKTLPDHLIVLPGHNYGPTPTASVKHEKETNRFLICPDKETFLRKRR